MRLEVAGRRVFGHTGGAAAAWPGSDPAGPRTDAVVLVHGAGNDHSVWRYQTRLLAGLGLPVVALDLPGHGRSDGPARTAVEDLATFVLDVLDALEVTTATVVGHSMGSLTAVATAAVDPLRVRRIGLVGTAAAMPVHPELQAAADAGDPHAIDLIVGWTHTAASRFGGHRQAGVWTPAQTRRLLERNRAPLGTDLAACAAYDAAAVAGDLDVDALVVAGERDLMTPARAGRALAGLLGAPVHVVPGGSHASLYDHPDEVNAALVPWLMGTG